MPADVDESLRSQRFLKSDGPLAPWTVRRRLANWSTLTKWRGLAVRAAPRTGRRKSAKAVTGDVLAKLLATCATNSLRDLRDRAILMVGFASGGRRRSEIAGLRREQLTVEPLIPVGNGTPSPLLPSISATKTPSGNRTMSSI
jgi:integrase